MGGKARESGSEVAVKRWQRDQRKQAGRMSCKEDVKRGVTREGLLMDG